MITFKKEVEQRPSFEQPQDVPSQIPLNTGSYSSDTPSYSTSTHKVIEYKERINKGGCSESDNQSEPSSPQVKSMSSSPLNKNSNQTSTSQNVNQRKLDDLPTDIPKNLGEIWLNNTPKMNQILVDKVTKKMLDLKKRHYDEGWDDQNVRSEYFKMKSFVKYGQQELYGMDLLVV